MSDEWLIEDVLILCTGKKEMEREIMMLEDQFPDAAKGIAEFSTPLAHQIIAGQHHFAASLYAFSLHPIRNKVTQNRQHLSDSESLFRPHTGTQTTSLQAHWLTS